MVLKRGLDADDKSMAKRLKSSEDTESQFATPEQEKIPFKIFYPDVSADRKTLPEDELALIRNAEYHVSPFKVVGAPDDKHLDQHYTVVPSQDWSDMKKYNNFVIQGETYKNDAYVYVRGESTPLAAKEQDKDFWVARIIEVRAANAKNVYALVVWMYWPEELPVPKKKTNDLVDAKSGRRIYHSSHELVASNYMEVLDVLTFAGKADVLHWEDEEPDSLRSRLYWRQTLCRETEELSRIREHCICGGHFNPEIIMEICDNPSCKTWLHGACLIDDILTKTYNSKVLASVEGTGGRVGGRKGKKTPIWQNKFSAEIVGPESDGGHTEVVITDMREAGSTWTERVSCLKCHTLLE